MGFRAYAAGFQKVLVDQGGQCSAIREYALIHVARKVQCSGFRI